MTLTAVGIACQDDRVNTGESGKQKGSGKAKLSHPYLSLRKDADGDEAIVEESSTWAIYVAKRISADKRESWRCWRWVREICVEGYTISG